MGLTFEKTGSLILTISVHIVGKLLRTYGDVTDNVLKKFDNAETKWLLCFICENETRNAEPTNL